MTYDIGTARGVIEMEYNGRGVEDAKQDQDELQKKGESTQQSLNKVSNTSGVAGAAIAGGLALAVNAAADFEHRMSAVAAVSGANAKEMDALSAKALQLGKDTSFSATESATAIEELVKAGISVEDVLNGAADAVVNLAAAGEISMPEAATIASNAMNQFGLGADDMVNVANKIAGAANASAIDVSELGQSMQQAGAVANLAGVSFDDTATAIALMGNAGIKGSDAGTSLKTFLQNLQPSTIKQTNLFKELGLQTYNLADANEALAKITGGKAKSSIAGVTDELGQYVESIGKGNVGTQKNAQAVDALLAKYGGLNNAFYDAEGNTKSLAEVSGVLKKSLKGMTAQQKQATLETLFGSDAIRAAAILSNNGAKGFNKMAKSMDKTTAAEVAAKRLDNFKGSLEQLKGSLETAGIGIGSALLPALNDLVGILTAVTNGFLTLSPGMQKFIAFTLAAIAAVLLIVAVVGKTIIFVSELSKALAVLRAALASTWLAALGPAALIVAAIVAIIALVILLWKKNETFRKIVIATWNAIKAAVLAVGAWFAGPFVNFFVKAWDMITNAFTSALNFLKSSWKTVLLGIILGPLTMIIAIIKKFWPMIRAMFAAGLASVISISRAVWNTIKAVFRGAMKVISTVIRSYLNVIKAIWSAIFKSILAVARTIWGTIIGVVRGYLGTLRSIISAAWGALKSITSAAWNAWVTIVRGAIDKVTEAVRNIKGHITGALSGAASWLYDKGREIIQGLINGIASMAGALKDKAKSVIGDGIGKLVPGSPVKEGPLKKLNRGHAGKQIVQMVIDGITARTGDLEASLSGVGLATSTGHVASFAPTGRVRAPAKTAPMSRIVSGTLALDPSGRAFIAGIAEDVVDESGGASGRRDRMDL